MKKRTFLIWFPVGIVILLLLIALAGYGLAMREKPDLKRSGLSAVQQNEVPLGSKADLRLEVTLPVHLPPPVCTVTAPAGTVAGAVHVRHGNYLWKYNRWIIQCSLFAVKPGAATGGAIHVAVKGNFPAEETFAIPDFVIAPIQKTGDLPELAGKLEESAKPVSPALFWTILGGALVIFLGIWLWLRWKYQQKSETAVIPPWVQAELALNRISIEVERKETPLGTAFFRLTDVVRKYLEDRYHLPVTSRTTDEFMIDMRNSSPLPEVDQPFLREFLTSADLIKFAKMPPDENGIRHALNGAKELVRHTTPLTQEGEGKHV